ncbi:MAG: hypothetical protein ABIS92_18590 [Polyangia bacterium]
MTARAVVPVVVVVVVAAAAARRRAFVAVALPGALVVAVAFAAEVWNVVRPAKRCLRLAQAGW